MRVLVAVASRRGATASVGADIAEELRRHRIDVEERDVEIASAGLHRFDGVVIGSGVRDGRWLTPAIRLVAGRESVLRTLPLWFFTGVPDPGPEPCAAPDGVLDMVQRLGGRGHSLLSPAAPRAVRDWALMVATELRTASASTGPFAVEPPAAEPLAAESPATAPLSLQVS